MSNSNYITGYPKRLTRAESFLGIHFDFHADDTDIPVGRNTTRAMIERIIDEVGPDYIQCDCKGHRGFSSYPTLVGNPAPVIVGDPLQIWREVTAERGVALFMHYSGLWDTQALKHHPEWARINEKGEQDPNTTSIFSAYTDELMLPQLKELNDIYNVDGVWVDGDCWMATRDYCDAAIQEFQQKTGILAIPRKPEDPYYEEYSQISREIFRRFLRHYVDQMHLHNPQFQVASNWAFSSFMPEPVTANVDFISGDSSSINGSYARLEARCMVHQGKAWDIMTWSFAGKWPDPGASVKSTSQLRQEAATIISLGGGYQSVSNQKKDGTVIEWQLQVMKEVAKFCRERQQLCHHAELIPQIALVYSGTGHYAKSQPLFNSGGQLLHLIGTLDSLLETQNVVEIVMEHQFRDRMQQYPLIIIPEWEQLTPGFKEELLSYTKQGGKLLVIGPKAIKLFEQELDISLEGEVDEKAVHWIEHKGWLAGHSAPHQEVTLGEKAIPFGKLFSENDNTGSFKPAASITSYGEGEIAALYINYGEFYEKANTSVARNFLNSLVRELFPNPQVTVTGSSFVDVVLAKNHGKTIVHLINTAGQQKNPKVYVFDEIPAIGPLEVTLQLSNKPESVTLEPGETELPYVFEAGQIKLTVPKLDIHRMIVVG